MSNKQIYIFFLATLIAKLVLSFFVPILPDEAYYWVWAKNLSWSYFDHPPMIAWLLAISNFLNLTGSFVRWPGIILAHGMFYIWYKIYLQHKQEASTNLRIGLPMNEIKDRLYLFLLIFFLHPFIGFGLIVLTPDLVYLFFSSLAIYYYLKIQKNTKNYDVVKLGLFLGLAFTSKYHAVLLGLVFLLHAVIFNKTLLNLTRIILLLICGLIGTIPVLYWNWQNDWASFIFQIKHGFTSKPWKPDWTLSYIASQALLISPFVFFFHFKLLKSFRELKENSLLSLSMVVLFSISSFFLYSSTKGFVEANWGLIALPLPLLAFALYAKQNILKLHLIYFTLIAIIALGLVQFSKKDNLDAKYRNQISDSYLIKKISAELTGYSPLYAGTYQTASLLWFYMQKPVLKLHQSSRYDMYDFWSDQYKDSTKQSPMRQDTFHSDFYLFKLKETPLPDWLNEISTTFTITEVQEFYNQWHLIKINRNSGAR